MPLPLGLTCLVLDFVCVKVTFSGRAFRARAPRRPLVTVHTAAIFSRCAYSARRAYLFVLLVLVVIVLPVRVLRALAAFARAARLRSRLSQSPEENRLASWDLSHSISYRVPSALRAYSEFLVRASLHLVRHHGRASFYLRHARTVL